MNEHVVICVDPAGKDEFAGHVYIKRGAVLVLIGELTALHYTADGAVHLPAFVPATATVEIHYPFRIFDPPVLPPLKVSKSGKGPPPQPTGKGRLKRW